MVPPAMVMGSCFYCKLKSVQKGTGISVCSFNQMLKGSFFKFNLPVAVAAFYIS